MAAALLRRALPPLRSRFIQFHLGVGAGEGSDFGRLFCDAAAGSAAAAGNSVGPSVTSKPERRTLLSSLFRCNTDNKSVTSKPSKETDLYPRGDDPEFRKWKIKEAEILQDVEKIVELAQSILSKRRYSDGERLTREDEKAVLDKLLAYHPQSEDKIGCGIDYIKVDRHPEFKSSRCLFVVRTDGSSTDFSYHKCLRAYIQEKYPFHAECFIKLHFKGRRYH